MTVHVFPNFEADLHNLSSGVNCRCKPLVNYVDGETGEVYNEPLVIHNELTIQHADGKRYEPFQ